MPVNPLCLLSPGPHCGICARGQGSCSKLQPSPPSPVLCEGCHLSPPAAILGCCLISLSFPVPASALLLRGAGWEKARPVT